MIVTYELNIQYNCIPVNIANAMIITVIIITAKSVAALIVGFVCVENVNAIMATLVPIVPVRTQQKVAVPRMGGYATAKDYANIINVDARVSISDRLAKTARHVLGLVQD